MKKQNDDILFLLFLLWLIFLVFGCTSLPKTLSYTCRAIGPHGVYARWVGDYDSVESAEMDGNTIIARLVKDGVIPDHTFAMCNKTSSENGKMPGERPGDN